MRTRRRFSLTHLERRETPATFVVTTTADNPASPIFGSLRWTINAANAHPGHDTIIFGHEFDDTANRSVGITAALPAITEAVTINGGPNKFEIHFTGTTPNVHGLVITGSNSDIRNLAIHGFTGDGIRITGKFATGNLIRDNFIGTDRTGTTAPGNSLSGVAILNGASHNQIGQFDPNSWNVIAGNGKNGWHNGVYVGGSGTGNQILGNYIGIDNTGVAAAGNGQHGIWIDGAANTVIRGNRIGANGKHGILVAGSGTQISSNYVGLGGDGQTALGNGHAGIAVFAHSTAIGGPSLQDGNVISANKFSGIQVGDGKATFLGTSIRNNYVGTDNTGTVGIGNVVRGVWLYGSPAQVTDNLVGGNGSYGIDVGTDTNTGKSADGSVVANNRVGLNVDGTAKIGNGSHGVYVHATPNVQIVNNFIGGNGGSGVMLNEAGTTNALVSGNVIGGVGLGNKSAGVMIVEANNNQIGTGNVIRGNFGAGVAVVGKFAVNNRIFMNSNFGNGQMAIDLGNNGYTPNDPLDADTGPNQLLNSPVITQARIGAMTTIAGTYSGLPNTQISLEFSRTEAGLMTISGGGQTVILTTTVQTDAAGFAAFEVNVPAIPIGDFVTATAAVGSNTSEYSSAVAVKGPPKVASVVVNDGQVQRSRVTSVTVHFDQMVNLPATASTAFHLVRQSDNMVFGTVGMVTHGATTSARLTFTGAGLEAGSLPDGDYTLTVMAGEVSNWFGQLDGNGDGVGGDNFTAAFSRRFGDVNGDGLVNFVDFLAFRGAFGSTSGKAEFIAAFDVDGNGTIDFTDFLAFRDRFGA